jgi:lipopolysaccharide export system protein LptA
MRNGFTGALLFTCVLVFLCSCVLVAASAEELSKKGIDQPVVVNGDTVEYSTDNREVIASGNVEVIYKGTKLTCDKLTVNMQSKDAVAEGNARVEDDRGIIVGEKINYNFDTKKGAIADAQFRFSPYFGKAKEFQRVSEAEFMGTNASMTTCSNSHPHYSLGAKKIDVFPGDKVRTKSNTFYLGDVPIFHLPWFNRSLKDPSIHIQVNPGKDSEWGPYLLTATRYNLTDYASGRIYMDYRANLGTAEGFGLNYTTPEFGKGDFKYYYTQERPRGFEENAPGEFERYLIRLRHRWEIDPYTNLTSEFYKIEDSKRMLLGPPHNILKDYFRREYETDVQPLSYALFHHNFTQSSLDVLLQPRVNSWYTEVEKLPEVNYSLPSLQIGDTPLYFQDSSQIAVYNLKNALPSDSTDDEFMTRFDTTNRISLPMRVSFVGVTPYVASRQTLYDKNNTEASFWSHPRTVFYAGADASTKFFRMFDVKTNAWGLDINGLRHVITPIVGHSFNHEPTQPSAKLKQFDAVDALTRNNATSFEIDNKLQTKRKGQKVDIVDFRTKTIYAYKPKGGSGSSFSDFIFDLDLIPYSWVRFISDATYNHFNDYFTSANYDITFDLAKNGSIGLGQRYDRQAGNSLTFGSAWRLNPKWTFSVYERYQIQKGLTVPKGFREQEYTLTRNLHCWDLAMTYNIEKDQGESIWFIFRLKAFPEMEFNFNQSYHAPKTGSQSP